MSTITARPLADSTDSLLRFGMRADATVCAAAGLLVAFAADPLARLSGLSATAEWIAGAALVLVSLATYVLAAAPDLRVVGTGVAVANVAMAAVTLAVVLAGVLPLTGAGVALMLAFAATTFGFAYLQYLGVRRLA